MLDLQSTGVESVHEHIATEQCPSHMDLSD